MKKTIIIFLVLLSVISYSFATEKYTYDDAGRITRATFDDGSFIQYTYDKNGNILTIESKTSSIDDFSMNTTDDLINPKVITENNGNIEINIDIIRDCFLEAKLTNNLGEELKTLISNRYSPSLITFRFNLSELSSGVYYINYFVKSKSGIEKTYVSKITILK